MHPSRLVFYSLLVLLTLSPLEATIYHASDNATGTPGGTRFQNEIGLAYSEQILELASNFIWQTFKQGEGDRKNVQEVTMVVESLDHWVAYTLLDKIHVSEEYIASYSGDVRIEMIGVLYHETTHVWQWKGNSKAPTGLIEGIADFVRLKAGWAPSHWVKRGTGKRWDEGYAVTAYFLDYCNSIKDGFVASLNGLMKEDYSDGFFVQLLGKTVDELWKDYKTQYGS